MAWGAGVRTEIRSTGAITNGGAFDGTRGTPLATYTGAAGSALACAKGSTTVTTDAGATHFTAAMVGHALVITGGTNLRSEQYTIKTFVGDHEITVDFTPAPWADGTAGIGTVSEGKDFSQQDGDELTFASADHNLLCDGVDLDAVSAEHADETFTADHVGNALYVATGTYLTAGGTLPQWFIINSVAAGVATLDRAISTGVGATTDGTGSLGGAYLLGSNADAFMENSVAGVKHWMRGVNPGTLAQETYTSSDNVAIAAAGSTSLPITIEGYRTTRGDEPTGDYRPIIACGTKTWTQTGGYWNHSHLIFTISSSLGVYYGATGYGIVTNCKFIQTSTTANYPAAYAAQFMRFLGCDFQAAYGYGLTVHDQHYVSILRCWMHDSSVGLRATSGSYGPVLDCLIESCGTGLAATSSNVSRWLRALTIHNCVTAVSVAGVSHSNVIENCIFAYNGTGLNWTGGTNYLTNALRYNNFYGNGTDVATISKGLHDTAYDPAFVGEKTWTDLTFVHGGSPLNLVSAAGGFNTYFPTASLPMCIYLTGTAANHWIPGIYVVTALVDDNTITLATDPTVHPDNGHDGTARRCTDFTVGAASSCRGAGIGLGLGVGTASTVEQGAWQAGAGAGGGYMPQTKRFGLRNVA